VWINDSWSLIRWTWFLVCWHVVNWLILGVVLNKHFYYNRTQISASCGFGCVCCKHLSNKNRCAEWKCILVCLMSGLVSQVRRIHLALVQHRPSFRLQQYVVMDKSLLHHIKCVNIFEVMQLTVPKWIEVHGVAS